MLRPKYPPLVQVQGIGFPDVWCKLVNECMKNGALKKRFYGQPVNTYDIISTTEIRRPLLEPMLHKDFPTKELHCAEYEKQWERDYDWIKQGFEYNYMDRLVAYPTVCEKCDDSYYHHSQMYLLIDQLKVIRENIAKRIEKGGECLVSNRDQVITWIPDRDMFVTEDQPCLQRIQFFVYEYPKEEHIPLGIKRDWDEHSEIIKGKVEFHVMWRSRDLYAAWNTNEIALTKMLMKEIFEPNNLELIRIIDFCNSNHIYEADWESASRVKQVAINPMLMRQSY